MDAQKISLVRELIKLSKETEWVEFKHNNSNPDEIGEYISALSNSAMLHDKHNAYMIWGVDGDSHEIIGTSFNYRSQKINNEELGNWLRHLLTNNANFSFSSVEVDAKQVVLLTIHKTIFATVKFKNIAYIRVGSYKKALKDHPAIEAQLWHKINAEKFETLYAKRDLNMLDVLRTLDYNMYFDLLNIPRPAEQETILHYLSEEGLVAKQDNGMYAITNLGAITFAKESKSFDGISRKSIRVIQYKGMNRTQTNREDDGTKGYAVGFEGLLKYVEGLLPVREEINGALRKTISVYPPIALRELIANALIHQDFTVTGTGSTIELFDNRVEITNPGTPLIDSKRFIDNPPRSRNEKLSALMRRANICEERGSGWDKIVLYCEKYQIPAPKIDIYPDSTRVTIFSYIPFSKLALEEKIWSAYMHACLKHESSEQMTNTTLRERFGVPESNKSAISKLIAATIAAKLIRPLDPDTAPRYMCYVPYWA